MPRSRFSALLPLAVPLTLVAACASPSPRDTDHRFAALDVDPIASEVTGESLFADGAPATASLLTARAPTSTPSRPAISRPIDALALRPQDGMQMMSMHPWLTVELGLGFGHQHEESAFALATLVGTAQTSTFARGDDSAFRGRLRGEFFNDDDLGAMVSLEILESSLDSAGGQVGIPGSGVPPTGVTYGGGDLTSVDFFIGPSVRAIMFDDKLRMPVRFGLFHHQSTSGPGLGDGEIDRDMTGVRLWVAPEYVIQRGDKMDISVLTEIYVGTGPSSQADSVDSGDGYAWNLGIECGPRFVLGKYALGASVIYRKFNYGNNDPSPTQFYFPSADLDFLGIMFTFGMNF